MFCDACCLVCFRYKRYVISFLPNDFILIVINVSREKQVLLRRTSTKSYECLFCKIAALRTKLIIFVKLQSANIIYFFLFNYIKFGDVGLPDGIKQKRFYR